MYFLTLGLSESVSMNFI